MIKARDRRYRAIQSLHSDKQGRKFQEDDNIDKDKGTLPGPFQPQFFRSSHAHQSANWRYLGIFLPDRQNLWSNILTSFSSWVFMSAVFPTRLDLFLQRKDSTGQPMGSHANSCQALLFQVVDFVGQSCYLREFKWGGLLTPSSLELRESAYKGREARLVVLTIKPSPMPSPERSLQRKVKEANTRVGLKTYTPITFRLVTLGWYFKKNSL
jgi:hypothetical protein